MRQNEAVAGAIVRVNVDYGSTDERFPLGTIGKIVNVTKGLALVQALAQNNGRTINHYYWSHEIEPANVWNQIRGMDPRRAASAIAKSGCLKRSHVKKLRQFMEEEPLNLLE